jgi:nicotinamidase-related amidase
MKKISIILILVFMTCSVIAQEKKEGNTTHKEIKPALLVIDVQNDFLKYMSDEKNRTLEMINGAIWVARQHDIPVIRVYHTDPKWGPAPGTEPFEFPKSVIIKEDDPKVVKNYPSGFRDTDLDKILKEQGCNTLFLCGLSATGCVLATYFGGTERNYDVFMIKEAILSPNHPLTDAVENICEAVTLDTFNFMMEHQK